MIDFDGIDMIVRHRPEGTILRQALSAALGLPEGRILLIDDIADYPARRDADVVCVWSPAEGEFAGLLSIQLEPIKLPMAHNKHFFVESVTSWRYRSWFPMMEKIPI